MSEVLQLEPIDEFEVMLDYATAWLQHHGVQAERSTRVRANVNFVNGHLTFITQGEWVWRIAVWKNGRLSGTFGGLYFHELPALRKILKDILCLLKK